MERASNIFSWYGGIFQIVVIWIWMVFYSIGTDWKWLIAIAVVYTIVGLIILIARQKSVSEGERLVAWGIITMLFISFIGGILTLCIPSSYGGYTHHTHYYASPSSTSSFSSNQQNTEQKPQQGSQQNVIEEKKIDEYIFVKPSENDQVSVGSIVKIIKGFFASAVGQRVANDDVCEVIEVDGEYLTVQVDHGISIFRAKTSLDNVYIRVKNHEFVAQESERQDEICHAFVPNSLKGDEDKKPETEQKLDKFEEIKKYKELLDLNIITKEEFDQKKKELLG